MIYNQKPKTAVTKRKARAHYETYRQRAEVFVVHIEHHNVVFTFY